MLRIGLSIVLLCVIALLSGCVDNTSDPYFIYVVSEGDASTYHYDILVKRSDLYNEDINNGIEENYVANYPNYQHHDYLSVSEEYISHCAYVNGDSCWLDYTWPEENEVLFMHSSFRRYSSIKLVVFDDDGTTIAISDANRLKAYNIDYMERKLSYSVNANTNEIVFSQQLLMQERVIFLGILAMIVSVIASSINMVFSLIIARDKKILFRFYQTSLVTYIFLMSAVFFLPIQVRYLSLLYVLILVIGMSLQFAVLYLPNKHKYSWKRVLTSVLLSSIITMIFSLVFYFQGYDM